MIARSQLLCIRSANPLRDNVLQSLWNQALNEMIENSNQALREMPNLWLFGITDSKGKVELFFYFIYSQIHTSFLSLLQKYISNVLHFTELHLLSQLRQQVNVAEAVDIKTPKKRVDELVNADMANLSSRSVPPGKGPFLPWIPPLQSVHVVVRSSQTNARYWKSATCPYFPHWCFPCWCFPWQEQLRPQLQGNGQFLHNPKVSWFHVGREHLVPISRRAVGTGGNRWERNLTTGQQPQSCKTRTLIQKLSQLVSENKWENLMKSPKLVCMVEDVSPISLPWDMTRKEYK